MTNTSSSINTLDAIQLQTSELDDQIGALTIQFCDLWTYIPDTPIPFGRAYSTAQKQENELRLEEILREAEREAKSRNGVEKKIGRLRDCIRDLVLDTVDKAKRDRIRQMLNRFSDAGDEFVHRSREFDGELRFEGIFQALRNLWIINSMQEAFGLPVCVSPSGLAYSLLYTYSDNFLDSVNISQADKEEFGRRFGQRLSGMNFPEESKLLSNISTLVKLIETEYPRALFPKVYASLLAIHRAQQKSLQQRKNAEKDGDIEILEISVVKGGTSVVSDAYVAKGRLTSTETSFAFGYGVFLQFIDDLQDVGEDIAGGSETLFTRAARAGTLDGITNRLMHYLRQVLLDTTPLQGPNADALTELILQGSLGLILESIALNPARFSEEYVWTAESYSPVGFKAIRQLHSKRTSLEMNYQDNEQNLDSLNHLPINRTLQEAVTPIRFATTPK